MIHELDLVALTTDLPAHSPRAGAIGTVVLVAQGGTGSIVECIDPTGDTSAIVVLVAEQVRPLQPSELRAP